MIQCNSFELVLSAKDPLSDPLRTANGKFAKKCPFKRNRCFDMERIITKKPLDQILQDILNTYELSESDRPFCTGGSL